MRLSMDEMDTLALYVRRKLGQFIQASLDCTPVEAGLLVVHQPLLIVNPDARLPPACIGKLSPVVCLDLGHNGRQPFVGDLNLKR